MEAVVFSNTIEPAYQIHSVTSQRTAVLRSARLNSLSHRSACFGFLNRSCRLFTLYNVASNVVIVLSHELGKTWSVQVVVCISVTLK
jgi:hypothetical protein